MSIQEDIQQGTGAPSPTEVETGGKLTRYAPVLAVVLMVLVGAAGATAYYFYDKVNELKGNPQKAAEEETRALIERVSQLIFLPTDEQPTIATVADPEKLKGQQFFANAHLGDKVFIYTNARKAILYDPVANKIIEVAPLSIGQQTAGASTEADKGSDNDK